MTQDKYKKLYHLAKKNARLNAISSLLEWDQETYMPQAAVDHRAEQLEDLSEIVHEHKTGSAYRKALEALIDLETGAIVEPGLSSEQQVALRYMRKDFLKAVKLPPAFVKEFAKTTAHALHNWIKAKHERNFSLFLPHLEKIVELNQKKSEILGYQESPYDALLDLYEPDCTSRFLSPLFERLKKPLMELVQEVGDGAIKEIGKGEFPIEEQLAFGKRLLHDLGFDPASSRLDLSSHPFCMGLHGLDTRLTTRIDPHNVMSNIFSVIHEAGHGLYNRGLPPEHYGSPLGEQVSLGIDESQSRFWETRIGRSLPFWKYYLPRLKEAFPKQLKEVTLEEFYAAINHVSPSFIRVEADEITYSLHVIVRYELEKALIEGILKVRDLPQAWNAKMTEYLKMNPRHDGEGCLQDIHWAMGGFGYFPTYTLGNLYASQFFAAFEKDFADWDKKVAAGELAFIAEWLRQKIHRYGRLYSSKELVKQISGESLNESYFLNYLKTKYLKK